jgi:uncharacterized protein YgiM (DUF1202 family)
MKKINRVERVALSGGLIGLLATNPRAALGGKIEELNSMGWNCHQIIDHSTRNTLAKILQIVILILTFGLWTFGAGYILLFEKEIEGTDDRKVENRTPYSTYSATHRVKLLTTSDGLSLRKEPDSQFAVFTKISNGTEVQVLEIGDEVVLKDRKAKWYKIRTKDDIIGWCFSGSLIKL